MTMANMLNTVDGVLLSQIPELIRSVYGSDLYQWLWKLLFSFFAMLLAVRALAVYMLEGEVEKLLGTAMFITFLWLVISEIDNIVGFAWDGQAALGRSIVATMFSQESDGSKAIFLQIGNVWKRWDAQFNDIELSWNLLRFISEFIMAILDDLWELLSNGALTLVLLVLGLLAYIIDIWAHVGFAVVAIFGQLLLPFMMFRPLEGLASGWINGLAATLLYALVASVVVSFCGWGFDQIDQSGLGTVGERDADLLFFSEGILLAVWAVVSIAAFLSVGKIAGSLGGGGAAGAAGLGQAAMGIRKLMTGGF